MHVFYKITSELLFNYRLNKTSLALVKWVSINCNLVRVPFHAINLIQKKSIMSWINDNIGWVTISHLLLTQILTKDTA